MTQTHYCRELRRGIRFDPHPDGGGTYSRMPVWEFIVVLSMLAILGPALLLLCLAVAPLDYLTIFQEK